MNDYSKLTSEEFDRLLGECLEKHGAKNLLSIPGIYEAVSEHFNNEVLSTWQARQTESSAKCPYSDCKSGDVFRSHEPEEIEHLDPGQGLFWCQECGRHFVLILETGEIAPEEIIAGMKTFKWLVEFEIDQVWIADGLELDEENTSLMIQEAFRGVSPDEVKTRIVQAPDPVEIARAQGHDICPACNGIDTVEMAHRGDYSHDGRNAEYYRYCHKADCKWTEPRPPDCKYCNNTGVDPETLEKCPDCQADPEPPDPEPTNAHCNSCGWTGRESNTGISWECPECGMKTASA